MTSSKITCKFFKLTGINNLEEVRENILQNRFAEPLRASKADSEFIRNLPYDERNFFFTWKEVSSTSELMIQPTDEMETCVEYLITTANIEYPKRRKRDSSNNILPKQQRLNTTDIVTYFLSFNDNVYIIICTSNTSHQERVRQLVGTSFITDSNTEYEIPPDLFNWMFFQYIRKEGSLDEKLKLMNIGGFIGNIADEHNIFKGISDQTSELIITKAFISNGEILKTVTARLRNEDIDIVFAIDEKSNTQIFVNQSEKLKLLEAEVNETFFIIYLYSHLIPELINLYIKDSESFLSQEKKQFSEGIGLEVIKSIIDRNSLSLEDVSKLFDTPSNLLATDPDSRIVGG